MLAELAPVCAPETVAVSRLLDICLQQQVQHLSSVLTARLAPDRHVLDALWALFPSVTVTGLPKPTALALLRRLETHPRGLYAGAFGWVAGHAHCRFSLAIRGVFRYANTYPTGVRLVASGKYPVETVITHSLPLDAAEEAFDVALHQKDRAIKVTITP
jgi:anthranilate/para-aminobenzoate synthase component I